MSFDKGVCKVCNQKRIDLDDWTGVCVDCMFKMEHLNMSPEQIRHAKRGDDEKPYSDDALLTLDKDKLK